MKNQPISSTTLLVNQPMRGLSHSVIRAIRSPNLKVLFGLGLDSVYLKKTHSHSNGSRILDYLSFHCMKDQSKSEADSSNEVNHSLNFCYFICINLIRCITVT